VGRPGAPGPVLRGRAGAGSARAGMGPARQGFPDGSARYGTAPGGRRHRRRPRASGRVAAGPVATGSHPPPIRELSRPRGAPTGARGVRRGVLDPGGTDAPIRALRGRGPGWPSPGGPAGALRGWAHARRGDGPVPDPRPMARASGAAVPVGGRSPGRFGPRERGTPARRPGSTGRGI